jgi:hypothetical protein
MRPGWADTRDDNAKLGSAAFAGPHNLRLAAMQGGRTRPPFASFARQPRDVMKIHRRHNPPIASATPIWFVSPLAHKLMERTMPPGVRAIDVLMIDGIVMNVTEMANAIVFIADGVLPEQPLPDAACSLGVGNGVGSN